MKLHVHESRWHTTFIWLERFVLSERITQILFFHFEDIIFYLFGEKYHNKLRKNIILILTKCLFSSPWYYYSWFKLSWLSDNAQDFSYKCLLEIVLKVSNALLNSSNNFFKILHLDIHNSWEIKMMMQTWKPFFNSTEITSLWTGQLDTLPSD